MADPKTELIKLCSKLKWKSPSWETDQNSESDAFWSCTVSVFIPNPQGWNMDRISSASLTNPSVKVIVEDDETVVQVSVDPISQCRRKKEAEKHVSARMMRYLNDDCGLSEKITQMTIEMELTSSKNVKRCGYELNVYFAPDKGHGISGVITDDNDINHASDNTMIAVSMEDFTMQASKVLKLGMIDLLHSDIGQSFLIKGIRKSTLEMRGSMVMVCQRKWNELIDQSTDEMKREEESKRSPVSSEVGWKTQGNQHFKQGELSKAMECYTKGIEDSSHTCSIQVDFRLYLNRSLCAFKLGLFKQALSDINEAIILSHSHHKCLARKAQILYYGMNLPEYAKSTLKKALFADESNDEYQSLMNTIIIQSDQSI